MLRQGDRGTARLGFLCVVIGAIVMATAGGAGAEFRFRLGIDYLSRFDNLADRYEDNIRVGQERSSRAVDVDSVAVPVGISLFPYYQGDNGVTLGAGIGPFAYLFTADPDHGHFTHWQLPLSVTLGYTFFQNGPVSPYIRAGPSYHLADGAFYDKSNWGFTVAVGVEFLKTDHSALGLEAAYDSAEVDIDNLRIGGEATTGVRVAEFRAGVFFQFQ